MQGIETVAVTGAAGSVGGFVTERLLASGYRVVAIDREGTALPEETDRVEVRAGDLTDRAFCHECLRGADAVIHTAAVIDIAWSYDRLKPINVDAVRWLYEGARAARALVFVHFSSGSIYEAGGKGIIDEATPFGSTSAYEQSKIDSEEVLKSFHGRGGPAYVILRPSLIYGPRGRLLGAALAAVPPILRLFTGNRTFGFIGGPRTNWVHAEDVARAAVFCMEHEACWGEAYNVADDTPLPIADVFNAANKAYGLDIGRTVPVPPKWVSRMFYRLIDTDLFFQMINAPAGPLWAMVRSRHGLEDELMVKLDRGTVGYFVKDVIFSNEKLKAAGFELKWPDMRTGFPAVVEWYQESNWAPRFEPEPDVDVPDTWGFEFNQVLRGRWTRASGDGGWRRIEFAVTARAMSVRNLLLHRTFDLKGTVTAEGLARDADLVGTLEFTPVTRSKFIYEFDFEGDDGNPYHFRGVETIDPSKLLETMTTMELRVSDRDGETVGTGNATFDLGEDLLSMTASFRPIY